VLLVTATCGILHYLASSGARHWRMRAKESDGVLQAAVMLRSGVWLQSYGLCDGECVSDVWRQAPVCTATSTLTAL
jgi:hypothetical protein